MKLDTHPKESNGSTTVSFMVPNDMYEQLCDRLPKYGSRSDFFRTVVEQFLSGQLQIIQQKRF